MRHRRQSVQIAPAWRAPHHGPRECWLPGKGGAAVCAAKGFRKAISSSSSTTCRAATANGITRANAAIVRRPSGSTTLRQSGRLHRHRYCSVALGGFSRYVYLPLNAVLHRVPNGLSPEGTGVATPMSNGIQWTVMDGGVGYASTAFDTGPWATGAVLCDGGKAGGGESNHRYRHVEGRAAPRGGETAWRRRCNRRPEGGHAGSHYGDDQRPRCRRRGRLHQRAGPSPLLLGIEATKQRGATMVIQSEGNATFPDFPIGRLTRKG